MREWEQCLQVCVTSLKTRDYDVAGSLKIIGNLFIPHFLYGIYIYTQCAHVLLFFSGEPIMHSSCYKWFWSIGFILNDLDICFFGVFSLQNLTIFGQICSFRHISPKCYYKRSSISPWKHIFVFLKNGWFFFSGKILKFDFLAPLTKNCPVLAKNSSKSKFLSYLDLKIIGNLFIPHFLYGIYSVEYFNLS